MTIDSLKNVKEKTFIQDYLDLEDKSQEIVTELAMSVFEIDDGRKALYKAEKLLNQSRIQYIIRVTIQRRATETPEILEEYARKSMDRLDGVAQEAFDAKIKDKEGNDHTDWKARKIGVDADGKILQGYIKAQASVPVDKLEILAKELPSGLPDFVHMKPADLILLAEGDNEDG